MSDAQEQPKNPERHSTYVPKTKKSSKPFHPTPMLDQLESGPWPSFVTGLKRLAKDKILAGLPLKTFDRQYKDCLLVAVTERRTREEIDAYAAALAAAVA